MSEHSRLPVEEAINRIIAAIPRMRTEDVPLRGAVGRVLAEQIDAAYTHPAWRNSAMDGYAVHADDVRGATPDSPVSLMVSKRNPGYALKSPLLTYLTVFCVS